MKNLLCISVSAVILFTTACEKNDGLTDAERKAIGQYKFEKVVRHNGFLKSDNVTQQYNNMILQLNDKREAALIDQNNSITYFGKYDVVTEYNNTYTDDEGNSNSGNNNTIIIDIKSNNRGGNAFYWHGKNANITNRKIRFSAEKADGRYSFVLDKI